LAHFIYPTSEAQSFTQDLHYVQETPTPWFHPHKL